MDETNIIDIYTDWLNKNISIRKITNEIIKVNVPFLDIYNDHLQIFIINQGNNQYKLTDSSRSFNTLESAGVDIEVDEHIRVLNRIIDSYKANFDVETKEIYTECTTEDFPQAINILIQAMLVIGNISSLGE